MKAIRIFKQCCIYGDVGGYISGQMIRSIKYFLTLGSVFSFIFTSGQEKVLRLSDNKDYEMYFVNVQFRGEGDLQIDTLAQGKLIISWNKTESFVIDDSVTIHTLEDQWTGISVDEAYGCWYDYFIYLIEDGVIIEEMRVNDRCKQVITKHGTFNYSDSPFEMINKDKKIVVADITFTETKMGRDFIDDVKGKMNILAPRIKDADWHKFDGQMIIKTKKGSIDKREKKVLEKIKADFPEEIVDVRFLYAWPDDFLFNIYCSENFGAKFKGFEIGRGWERFSPVTIHLFSKTQAPITELVEKYDRQ